MDSVNFSGQTPGDIFQINLDQIPEFVSQGLSNPVAACERAIQILEDPALLGREIRAKAEPRAGRGVGCKEVPRFT